MPTPHSNKVDGCYKNTFSWFLKTDLQMGKLVTFQLIVTVSGTKMLKLCW